ncbi:diguanylate cyclase [Psychromonas sp. CNPT3]|uniref:bifunctional diguanylate cyclase/phosphodiesterase n=1 Tax=Psychromonas sp. CNPT3 TaxID=314282 RepID=UPI0002C0E002|nr:EAL domain-containing protein [Psychromonas sp. CNPT3]AGH82151.1 diguanylate cyclase [Psychromonas sp. CNPT3]
MSKFNRNIYLLFFFIAIVGASIIVRSVFVKKQDLIEKLKYEQLYVSYNFSSYLESIFSHYNTTVNLLSTKLSDTPKNKTKILEKALSLHPFLLAFAFFDKQGDIIAQTPNIPPLKVNKQDIPWLKIALQQQELLIRKPYWLKDEKKWIVPIFKRLTDEQGHIYGVLATGLDIAYFSDYHSTEKMLGNSVQITLADNNYRILRTNISENQYPQFYGQSLPSVLLKVAQRSREKHHITLDDLKTSGAIAQLVADYNDDFYAYSINYNKKYNLWINVFKKKGTVYAEIYSNVLHYSVFYFIILIVIFVFCRSLIMLEKSKFQALNYEVEHDNLTNLYSRKMVQSFTRKLKDLHQSFTLLYIDLDNFKAINKSLGHAYGDALLIEVSKRLESDIDNLSCTLCRYNADEFIVLIHSVDLEKVTQYTQNLLLKIAQPYKIKHNTLSITASIGAVRYPNDCSDINNLVIYAEDCMSLAKKNKNDYQFFTANIYKQFIKKVKIEQALRFALKNNEISLVYQPQLDTDNKVQGVEALVRWHSKELGTIPPSDFIPIAEENNMMPLLGTYIMQTAIKEISNFQNIHNVAFSLSINVSVRQFMQSNFIETLLRAYQPYRSDLLSITIEITESLFIENLDHLKGIFKQLKDQQIKLALDDFGTGYSSLNLLREIPIDELKIDKSFVDNISESDKDQAMLNSIISMAKNLNLSVLAEGVETLEHVQILKNLHCDLFQGYYFSKPLTLENLALFMTDKTNNNAS